MGRKKPGKAVCFAWFCLLSVLNNPALNLYRNKNNSLNSSLKPKQTASSLRGAELRSNPFRGGRISLNKTLT